MEEIKNEYYVSGKDKPLHIKEAFGGVYKKIKLLTMNSVSTEPVQKAQIAYEFKLATKETIVEFLEENKKNELSVEQFYEEHCKIIFIEEPVLKFDAINMAEVNRATESFFMSLNGK